MTQGVQTILSAGVPTLAIAIGIIVDNVRLKSLCDRLGNRKIGLIPGLDDMRSDLDQRFDDLEENLRADFRRMVERLR